MCGMLSLPRQSAVLQLFLSASSSGSQDRPREAWANKSSRLVASFDVTSSTVYYGLAGPKKSLFCVPTDELLQANSGG